jgi:ferrous iron transport protein B
VYVLFCGAFFPNSAGNVIFVLYLLGILVAVGLGYILKDSLFKQVNTPFFMEFPPSRKPAFKTGVLHMWERARVYLKKIGGVILIASIVIWFLGKYPQVETYSQNYAAQIEQLTQSTSPDAELEITQLERKMATEDIEQSYIGKMGSLIGPVIEPLGFNWQMGIALVTGFVAKEVVVSALGVLYQLGEDVDENSTTLIAAISSPSNGISALAAFAFLVFVLLYTPCISVVAVMRREIGAKWTSFGMMLQLVIPWVAAFAIYQGGKLIGLG